MEIRAGYQRTEAGVLPVTWQVARLGDQVKITSGISPSLLNFKPDGVPYFKVEQLSNSDKYLDGKSTPYHFQIGQTVQAGSVIFAKRGAAIALNKIRILSEESFMDTNLMSLTPSAALDVDYLFYGLGYIGLWRFADTTSVPQINNKHIKPLAFPLPEIQEQKAIAFTLSDVDALIAGLEKLIEKKRDIKQAAMQQLLTGQTRLPGFSGEWGIKRLDEIAYLYQPTTISANEFTESGFPVYGANGIVGYYHTANHETSQVTVTCRGSTCGTVNKTVDMCWITGNAMVLNCDQNHNLDKNFFYHLMINQDMSLCITGTGQPQIVRSPLAAFKVMLPFEIAEQTAIATIFNEMDYELLSLESRLTKTRDLKQGMMQELLTGRTRLTLVTEK